MTFLELVNKILRRLREDEVSSVSESDYSKLIGDFVNEAKTAIEDMWFWTVYETEVVTSILADGTLSYDLTETNDRSFLIRKASDQRPLAADVTTDGAGAIWDMPYKALKASQNERSDTNTVTAPQMFAIRPDADGRGWTLELLYGSTIARTWNTYWYIPQSDLAIDATDDNTNILLPADPIFQGALMYALNERGEEMGEPGGMQEAKFHRAAAAAMEIDMQTNKVSDERDVTNLETLRNNIASAI